jgi:hypothetical protein
VIFQKERGGGEGGSLGMNDLVKQLRLQLHKCMDFMLSFTEDGSIPFERIAHSEGRKMKEYEFGVGCYNLFGKRIWCGE